MALKIAKKYGSVYDYTVDLAKQSGVYNDKLANDADIGYAYINTLANWQSKKVSESSSDADKLEAQNMLNTIASVDTRLLNPTDAFTRIQLATGEVTEDEFKSYFKTDTSTFEDAFGTVEDYFEYQQQRGYDKLVFDNMTTSAKILNGVGYTLGEIGTSPLELVEGIIDAGGYLISGFGAWEPVANWVASDFTGAVRAKQELADVRRTRVDWDDRIGAMRVVGAIGNELGKTLITLGLNQYVKPITIAGKPIGIGSAVYQTGMAGLTASDALHRYGTGDETWLKRNADFALTMTAEILPEMMFKGGPVVKGGVLDGFKSATAVGRIGSSMVEEGIEEMVTEFIQPLIQYSIQNGTLEDFDANQWFKDIMTAGLIGSVMGGFGESVKLATTDVGSIGLFKDGAKVSRAQALNLIETVQANRKNIKKFLNSEQQAFADSNNFNQSDMEHIANGESTFESVDVNGNKITKSLSSKQKQDYQKAIEADAQTFQKYDAFMYNLSKIQTAIGKDKFKQDLELWDNTESKRLEVAQNWYEFLGDVDANRTYSKDVEQAVEDYCVLRSDDNIGITPVASRKLTDRQLKFMAAGNKLFKGAKVIFVEHRNLQTATPVTNLSEHDVIESFKGKNGQEYIFIDANSFSQSSLSENLVKLAKVEFVKSYVITSEFTKFAKKYVEGNMTYKDFSSKQNSYRDFEYKKLLFEILSDPETSAKVFMTDKRIVRNILKSLKVKRDNNRIEHLKPAYNNLIWTLKNNISRRFPKKARLLVLKQLETGLTKDDGKLMVRYDDIEIMNAITDKMESDLKIAKNIRNIEDTISYFGKVNTKVHERALAPHTKEYTDFMENYKKADNSMLEIHNELSNEYSEYKQNITNRAEIAKILRERFRDIDTLPGKLDRGEISKKEAKNILEEYNTLKSALQALDTKITESENKITTLHQTLKTKIEELANVVKQYKDLAEKEAKVTEADMIKELVLLEPREKQKDSEVEYEHISSSGDNTSNDRYWFHWGLITEDCSASETRVSECKHDLTEYMVSNSNGDFSDVNNYKSEFVQDLFEKYPDESSFENQISAYTYDNFGIVMLPDNKFVIPIEYTQYLKSQETLEFLANGSKTTADMFFTDEFFKKYPKLKTIMSKIPVETMQDFDNKNRGGSYKGGKTNTIYLNIAYSRPTVNMFLHELTHAILANLGITYTAVYDTTYYTSKEISDMYNEFVKYGLISQPLDESVIAMFASVEYYTIYPEPPKLNEVRLTKNQYIKLITNREKAKAVKRVLYKFDLNEILAKGEDKKIVNEVSDLSKSSDISSFKNTWPYYNGAYLQWTDKGIVGTGKLNGLKVNLSIDTVEKIKKTVRNVTKDSISEDDNKLSFTIDKSSSSENELSVMKTEIKNNINQKTKTLEKSGLSFLVASDIKDVRKKVANQLIESTNSASGISKKVLNSLKKEVDYDGKFEHNVENFITKLNESSKFSDGFKTTISSIIKNNMLSLSIPIRVEDIRTYFDAVCSNFDALEELPDPEVQFILKTCYNCESLKLKSGKDVKYWIETGFPNMTAIAMDDSASRDYDWTKNTISDVKKYFSKITEKSNDSPETLDFKNDEEYKKLEDRSKKLKKLSEDTLLTLNKYISLQETDVEAKEEFKELQSLKLLTQKDLEKYENSDYIEKESLDLKLKDKILRAYNDNEADLNTYIVNHKNSKVSTTVKALTSVDKILDNIHTAYAAIKNKTYVLLGSNETSKEKGNVGEIRIDKEVLKSKYINLYNTAKRKFGSITKTDSEGNEVNILDLGASSNTVKSDDDFEDAIARLNEADEIEARPLFGDDPNGYTEVWFREWVDKKYPDKEKFKKDILNVADNGIASKQSSSKDLTDNKQMVMGYDLNNPLDYVFARACQICAYHGHYHDNGRLVELLCIMFGKYFESKQSIKVLKFVKNMLLLYDFKNNAFKQADEMLHAFVDFDINSDRINAMQQKYDNKLKEYSSEIDLNDEDLKSIIKNTKGKKELEHYFLETNSTKADYQMLTLEYVAWKQEQVAELSEELKLPKDVVSNAFKEVREANTETTTTDFLLAVKEKLGVEIKKLKESAAKTSVFSQKKKAKVVGGSVQTLANAKIIVENREELENKGVDPEVLETAKKIDKGATSSRVDGSKLKETAKQLKEAKAAKESVDKKPIISDSKPETTKEVKTYVSSKVSEWIYDGDGNIKTGLLKKHSYEGTNELFNGHDLWVIEDPSNNFIVRQIIDELNNNKTDVNYFFELFWEIKTQLEQIEWIKVPVVDKRKENSFISDQIMDVLYRKFLWELGAASEILNNPIAKAIIASGAVDSMMRGIGLRSNLTLAASQYKVDEKAVENINTAWMGVDPIKVAEELEKLRKKLEELKAKYDKQRAEHFKSNENLEKIKAKRDEQLKQREEYKQKIEELREKLKNSTTDTSENKQIQSDINSLESKLNNLETDISNNEKSIKTIESDITTNDNALEEQRIAYQKLLSLLNDLNSNDSKKQARAYATMHQYKDQMPKDIKDAINESKLKELTQEAVDKYGKQLGLTSGWRTAYDRARRFRYIAMLSSPSTWQRNWLMNVGMKGVEALTEILSDLKVVENIATFGINFNKLTEDGVTQTITYQDDEGISHKYKLPIQNYDWKRIHLESYVEEWIAEDVFDKETLNKKFGFGGKYGEFKKQKDDAVVDVSHKDNWFDKFLDYVGTPIEYIMTATDAKFTHPMVKRVFGQLIMSNLQQIAQNILVKEAVRLGVDVNDPKFKNTESYKEVYDLVKVLKNNPSNASNEFSKFVKLIPTEQLEIFKDVAIAYTKKTFFKNDNAIGKWTREFIEKHPFLGIPIETLTPFIRMSANVANMVIDLSPLGFIRWLNSNLNYKKLVTKVTTLDTINGKELDSQLIEAQKELATIYSTLTNEKVDVEQIVARVGEDLKQYEIIKKDPSKGTARLTQDQYDKLKSKYKDVNAVIARRSNVLKERDNLAGSITGFEKVDMTRQFSKAVIGTSFMIVGIILYACGAFKIDKDEDYMGVVLDVFGWKIRLSDFSPISSSMIMGVALGESINTLVNPDYKGTETPFNTLITYFLNDTPVDFLTDAIEYSDNTAEWFANILSGLLSQYVPNIIKQMGKIFSQNKKVKSSDSYKRILQNVADTIPGFRDLVLENKIDPYTGEVVKRGDGGSLVIALTEMLYMVTGVKTVYRKTTATEKETKRLGVTSSGATGRFVYNNYEFKLTDSELTEFKQYRGTYIKNKFDKLISSSAYKKASDEVKKELIKDLYSKASDYAKMTWLKNNKGYKNNKKVQMTKRK